MRVLLGHLPGVGTTDRRADQLWASGLGNQADDLALGLPEKRVLHGERMIGNHRQKRLESVQHSRVRRSRRLAADHLGAHRQVHADHAVLVEPDVRLPEHIGDGRAQRDEQERPCALGVLLVHPLLLVDHDPNMARRVVRGLGIQPFADRLIPLVQLLRGSVID